MECSEFMLMQLKLINGINILAFVCLFNYLVNSSIGNVSVLVYLLHILLECAAHRLLRFLPNEVESVGIVVSEGLDGPRKPVCTLQHSFYLVPRLKVEDLLDFVSAEVIQIVKEGKLLLLSECEVLSELGNVFLTHFRLENLLSLSEFLQVGQLTLIEMTHCLLGQLLVPGATDKVRRHQCEYLILLLCN
jgi:hypothetical protein